MTNPAAAPPLVTRKEMAALLPEFCSVYAHRPIRTNDGGMGFNHSFAVYAVCKTLQPTTIIESGVWRGHSTWLLRQACPQAELICIDPRPDLRHHTDPRAVYLQDDFALQDWSRVAAATTLCFFDDHQSALARLIDMKWWGFKHALFEDNYPCGEGDLYSLRHVRAAFGHPHMQMSASYARRPRQLLKRVLFEPLLRAIYPRQQIVRRPNAADWAGVQRNLATYQELPAARLYDHNDWGGPWAGAYEPVPALDAADPATAATLDAIEAENPGTAFRYGYICYVKLGAAA